MSLSKIMEKHGEVKPIKKLVKDISKAACKGIENLWSEFLEMGDLNMVRATDSALRLLTGSGDHVKAMKLLEAIYALTEQEPPREFTACQEYPVLSQMYRNNRGNAEQKRRFLKNFRFGSGLGQRKSTQRKHG